MKIKTSELIGSNLDWAVAVAVGAHCQESGSTDLHTGKHWIVSGFRAMRWDDWTPSTDWSQGGPLIERFGVTVIKYDDSCIDADKANQWCAQLDGGNMDSWTADSPTTLIAACRAIVAAKLGDGVDVPEGLV